MLRRSLAIGVFALLVGPAWAQTTAPAQTSAPSAPTPPAAQQVQLQPYEATNALERSFEAAYRSEAMRPAFRRQFLESHVFLVTQSNAPDAPALLRPLRGNDRAALIFTNTELLERRMGPSAPRVSLTGRAALQRLGQHHVAINIGYDPMLVLDPAGVADFLGIPATRDSAGPSQ